MIGSTISGRYVLLEVLGTGGMSIVYKAHDNVLERDVAIKIMHQQFCSDALFLERFRREAIATANLSHPNIVSVVDTGEDNGIHYIVMEYVEGDNLKDIIAVTGPLSISHAINIAIRVGEALAYAHGRGLVHRDIKPHNIMITPEGTVKVTDFGIARALSGVGITQTGVVLGTAEYVSPEQAKGEGIDASSDIYSLGVVLYEMLTGEVPFKADTAVSVALKHLQEEPPDPREKNPHISKKLYKTLSRMLAKDKRKRYPEINSMLDDLRLCLEGVGIEETQVLLPNRIKEFQLGYTTIKRKHLFAGLSLIGVIVVLLVAVFLVKPEELPVKKTANTNKQLAVLTPIKAYDYDPQGDGFEHKEEVDFSFDQNLATAWRTQQYNSPNFGGLKEGVGIYHDLGEIRTINRLRIVSSADGWNCTIKGSNDAQSWKEIVSAMELSDDYTFKLKDVSYRYFLIWVSRLPGNQLKIFEVYYSKE